MTNLWRALLGVIAGLIVAPLAGLLVASATSRLGLTAIEVGFNPLPLDALTVTLGSRLASDIPSGAITLGMIVALIVAVGGGWLFFRLVIVRRWGALFTGAALLAAVSTYAWLAWDDQGIVIAANRLRPTAGVKREPRELFLEGTGKTAFGQPAGWPGAMDTPDDDRPSDEWLRQHSSNIHARWEQIRPVRDWLGRLDRYEGLDDYNESFASPLLAFLPIKHYIRASRDEALLAALEGRYGDAAEIEGQSLSFGRKLRNGSRCIVHLMIGTVIEKGALKNVQTLVERFPTSARACGAISGLIRAPSMEWDDLERVFLNEVMSVQAKLSGSGTFGPGLSGRIETDACSFLFNPNATAGIYRDHLMAITAACRRGDFTSAGIEEEDYARFRMRLRFKNFLGSFVLNVVSPRTSKLTQELDDMVKLRVQLAARLNAKGTPE